MPTSVADQLAYYRAHPPSALAAVRAEPTELSGVRFDGHGEPLNPVFAITCTCGSRELALWGWVREEEIGPPLAVACDTCGADLDLFDPSLHGYDAVASGDADDDDDDDSFPDEFPDAEPPYELFVRFEYSPSDFDDPRWAGRQSDLFSWITVVAKTKNGLVHLFDWECA